METILAMLTGFVVFVIGAVLAYGRANAENEGQGGDLMQGFIAIVMIFCVVLNWFYFIVSSIQYFWEKEWKQGYKYLKFK